ncbi:hypothetical protein PV326_012821 [Microctonus aethiopoides]|nr:hypothetical protein PV326_012821 [Microctonus aethiopoides]
MWRTLNTQSGTVEDASRWGSNRIQGALRRPRGRERGEDKERIVATTSMMEFSRRRTNLKADRIMKCGKNKDKNERSSNTVSFMAYCLKTSKLKEISHEINDTPKKEVLNQAVIQT